MTEILVLSPVDARWGFRLAGVRQQTLAPRDLEKVLEHAFSRPEIGMVAVDERLLSTEWPVERLHEIEHRWSGVVVLLPAPGEEALGAGEDVLRMVHQALGYQMRLTP